MRVDVNNNIFRSCGSVWDKVRGQPIIWNIVRSRGTCTIFELMELTKYFSRLSLLSIIKNNRSWIQMDCKLDLVCIIKTTLQSKKDTCMSRIISVFDVPSLFYYLWWKNVQSFSLHIYTEYCILDIFGEVTLFKMDVHCMHSYLHKVLSLYSVQDSFINSYHCFIHES